MWPLFCSNWLRELSWVCAVCMSMGALQTLEGGISHCALWIYTSKENASGNFLKKKRGVTYIYMTPGTQKQPRLCWQSTRQHSALSWWCGCEHCFLHIRGTAVLMADQGLVLPEHKTQSPGLRKQNLISVMTVSTWILWKYSKLPLVWDLSYSTVHKLPVWIS